MLALPVLLLLVLLHIATVYASPSPVHALERRSAIDLTAAQLAALAPYTQLARAAYCKPSVLEGWKCGEACDAVPGFQLSLSGGNGNGVQIYYVGYWPSENTVVVAHEGTDPLKFMSVLTDVNITLVNLESSLFPGVPSNVKAHQGFLKEHAQTATLILAEVKKLLESTGATSVNCIGHSLGGALAQLDSLYFTLNLPSKIAISVTTFGLPRVGNPAYATYFDSKVPNFQRVNNEHDIIPIVPGRGFGFQHPHGEIHLLSDSSGVACSGDDNADDPQCQIMTVPNVLAGNILNHLGPYQGIPIGTIFCY